MTILGAALSGLAILVLSLIFVVLGRYIGLVPKTKPHKRTYLFEDERGERQNPFGERNQEVLTSTAQTRTQADVHVLSSASDHTESTGGTHLYTQPDSPLTTDESTCRNCGFHNQSAYSFCSQCTARLSHKEQ